MAAIIEITARNRGKIDTQAMSNAITTAISRILGSSRVTTTIELVDDPATSLRIQALQANYNRSIYSLADKAK